MLNVPPPLLRSPSVRTSRLLIVAIALSGLAGCAHHYKQARESDPHATLTFEKAEKLSENRAWPNRAWPRKLNGGRTQNMWGVWGTGRRTFRIGVGTMRIELGEGPEGDLVTSGPTYTCELSFEAEAGRRYSVSVVWDDDVYVGRAHYRTLTYAVTADTGAKVAECKGRQKGEGAIVIRDEAPVYKKKEGTDVTWKLKRGDAVVACALGMEWRVYEESGRAPFRFLAETAGRPRGGWMSLADLAIFSYNFCNYDAVSTLTGKRERDLEMIFGGLKPGYPFTPGEQDWLICFREARDAKLKELRAAWAEEKAATSTKAPPGASDQQSKPEKP